MLQISRSPLLAPPLPQRCMSAFSKWSTAAWPRRMVPRWEPSQVRRSCRIPGLKVFRCKSSPQANVLAFVFLAATGTPFSVAAGRLSFTYGFSGPAVSIDTACSSAMVGSHMAVQHLQRHRGDALSAGVNLMLAERTTTAAHIAGEGVVEMHIACQCDSINYVSDSLHCPAHGRHADAGWPLQDDGQVGGWLRARRNLHRPASSGDCWQHCASARDWQRGAAQHVCEPGRAQQQPDGAQRPGAAGCSAGRSAGSWPAAPSHPWTGDAWHRWVLAFQPLKLCRSFSLITLVEDEHSLAGPHTGTPLGDPIEVGALTAVLPGGALPLRLTAAKSRFGHAEPAAGSVGMIQAALQLSNQRSNSITGLATINPYVASTFAELMTAGQATPYIPRQDASAVMLPLPADVGVQGAMGVSSFAFQGTNANVVLGRTADLVPAGSSGTASPWQRRLFWYTMPQHQMLHSCAAAAVTGTATMHCQLGSAPLAYLCDHQVRWCLVDPGAITAVHQSLAIG